MISSHPLKGYWDNIVNSGYNGEGMGEKSNRATSKLRSDWSINMRQYEVKGRSDTAYSAVILDRC